jgi:hypothetical protein
MSKSSKRVSFSEYPEVLIFTPDEKRVSWSDKVEFMRPMLRISTSDSFVTSQDESPISSAPRPSASSRSSGFFGAGAFRYPSIPSPNSPRRSRRRSCPCPSASPSTSRRFSFSTACPTPANTVSASPKASKHHGIAEVVHDIHEAWATVKHAIHMPSQARSNAPRKPSNWAFTFPRRSANKNTAKPTLIRARPISIENLFLDDNTSSTSSSGSL